MRQLLAPTLPLEVAVVIEGVSREVDIVDLGAGHGPGHFDP